MIEDPEVPFKVVLSKTALCLPADPAASQCSKFDTDETTVSRFEIRVEAFRSGHDVVPAIELPDVLLTLA